MKTQKLEQRIDERIKKYMASRNEAFYELIAYEPNYITNDIENRIIKYISKGRR